MNAIRPRFSPERFARALYWSALGLALAVRLALWAHRSGPLWFEEDVPLAWAWKLWGFPGRGFDPNPHSAIWPHVSVYVFFLVQALQLAAGFVTGAWRSAPDAFAAMVADPNALRAGAMLAAVAIGMVTLVASAALARRFAGGAGAAAVALVLAIDPLFVRHALVISPDMLLTLCTVLGLHAALDVIERGRLADSLLAGLWLGLGAACKYSPILLAVPVTFAHAYRPGGRRGLAVLADGRLWLAAAVSLAAFAVATPFTVLDLVARWKEFALGASVMGPGPTGNMRVYAGAEFFAHTLPGDLGPMLCLLLAGAALWALLRPSPSRSVLLAFLVVYLGAFSLVPTAFARYLMPAYPPALALGAAALAALASSRSRLNHAVAAMGLFVALAGLLVPAEKFAQDYFSADTRALARTWILANVPNGAVVATEQAGPQLPDRVAHRAAATPGISWRWHAALIAPPTYYTDYLPMSFPDPEISSSMYSLPDYADFDYLVSSTSVRGRYLAQPARFPVQAAFYEGLDRFGTCVYRSPTAGVVGPGITVYRLSSVPRDSLAAWWAARMPHPPGYRNAADAAYTTGFWRDRALLFTAAERWPAALHAWQKALARPGAPAYWWLQCARCAVRVDDRRAMFDAGRTAFRLDPRLGEAALLWAGGAYEMGMGARMEAAEALAGLRRGALPPEVRIQAASLEDGLRFVPPVRTEPHRGLQLRATPRPAK